MYYDDDHTVIELSTTGMFFQSTSPSDRKVGQFTRARAHTRINDV
jgi:hypothetical protein